MNYYAKAIDIIMDDRIGYVLLIRRIAQKHPKIICDAAEDCTESRDESIKKEYELNGKVAAIKLARQLTGLDLKGALELVTRLVGNETHKVD